MPRQKKTPEEMTQGIVNSSIAHEKDNATFVSKPIEETKNCISVDMLKKEIVKEHGQIVRYEYK